MRCPFCAHDNSQVKDSRPTEDNTAIRRRRQCEGCGARFTTFERVQLREIMVVKSNQVREPFDRAKIEHGLLAAVAKRPVSRDQVSDLALEVEREIAELGVSEIASRDVGERVLPRLRTLDQVAYVRFASIYRDFRDLEGFEKELDALRNDTGPHSLPGEAGDDRGDERTDEHPPVVDPVDPAERAG